MCDTGASEAPKQRPPCMVDGNVDADDKSRRNIRLEKGRKRYLVVRLGPFCGGRGGNAQKWSKCPSLTILFFGSSAARDVAIPFGTSTRPRKTIEVPSQALASQLSLELGPRREWALAGQWQWDDVAEMSWRILTLFCPGEKCSHDQPHCVVGSDSELRCKSVSTDSWQENMCNKLARI